PLLRARAADCPCRRESFGLQFHGTAPRDDCQLPAHARQRVLEQFGFQAARRSLHSNYPAWTSSNHRGWSTMCEKGLHRAPHDDESWRAMTTRSPTNSWYARSRSAGSARRIADGCTVAAAQRTAKSAPAYGPRGGGQSSSSPRWAVTRKVL